MTKLIQLTDKTFQGKTPSGNIATIVKLDSGKVWMKVGNNVTFVESLVKAKMLLNIWD